MSDETHDTTGDEHVIDPSVPFDPEAFEKLLQRECKIWQKRLRLQDWNVHVQLCRLNEMPGREALGAIFPSLERKDALMKLLSPMDVPLIAENFQGDEEMNYGLTIVHELIHIHLWLFTQNQDDAQLVAEEQAVNALSRSLVAAYMDKATLLTRVKSTTVAKEHGHYL